MYSPRFNTIKCFLLLILFFAINEANSVAIDQTILSSAKLSDSLANNNNRQLAQPAPYAIQSGLPAQSSTTISNNNDESINNNNQTVKNLVFRLAYNNSYQQSNSTLLSNSNNNNNNNRNRLSGEGDSSWSFTGHNGTPLVGSRINLDLNKLTEALNNQNITSEVKFHDNGNGGMLNITISTNNSPHETNKIDEYFLEDLMIESKYPSQINSSSIIKDNHRSSNPIDIKYQSRSKLTTPSPSQINNNNNLLLSNSNNNNNDLSLLTPPPIRATIDVVAENYTMRKIADEANIFSIRLLNQLNIEKLGSHNLIQAPFSVYQGLTLLLTGAMGETAKELDKVLLGSQSSYENNRLTHDQDRTRLIASLGDVIRQLQLSSSHHFKAPNDTDRILVSGGPYFGGTEEQHLIVANNLLFSSSAYEISNEFKNSMNTNYNNTALTRMEVGSTESIQMVNSWVRRVTGGLIPNILNRKTTFDEFNVMSLLSTSWLMQEWKDTFYRISSPIRSNIRLKGQGKSYEAINSNERREFNPFVRNTFDNVPLLEFIDDDKQSHFVEYLKSRPTKSIQHYHAILNGVMVDIVVVPFKDSNHRMITLTPLVINNHVNSDFNSTHYNVAGEHQTDSSSLTKLISILANNPRKAMRSLWAVVAPDIITKQTYQNIQLAKHMNISVDGERIIETTITPMVQLSMPMIRTDADSSISAALNHIGIVNAFDHDQANFIGINGHPFNYYRLHLSNVISKTTFNLDERGINYDRTIKSLSSMRIYPERQNYEHKRESQEQNTLKSSGTVKIDNKDYNLEFVDEVKLDRPYVYMITDIRTKLILYTGIMRNPQEQSQSIPQV